MLPVHRFLPLLLPLLLPSNIPKAHFSSKCAPHPPVASDEPPAHACKSTKIDSLESTTRERKKDCTPPLRNDLLGLLNDLLNNLLDLLDVAIGVIGRDARGVGGLLVALLGEHLAHLLAPGLPLL